MLSLCRRPAIAAGIAASLCICIWLLGANAFAREQGGAPPPFPNPGGFTGQQLGQREVKEQELKLSGKVAVLRPGQIGVSTNTGQNWWVKVPGDPKKIEVKGEGGPELLAPGAFIQFSAQLDKRGRAHGDVTNILVYTPAAGATLGVAMQESGGDAANFGGSGPGDGKPKPNKPAPKSRRTTKPGDEEAAPVEAADKDEATDKESKATDEDAANDKESEPAEKEGEPLDKRVPAIPTNSYMVAGQLRGIKNWEMSVFAGPAGLIKVPLAKDAKVKVETSDFSVVAAGDEIEANGKYTRLGEHVAGTVKITLSKRQPIPEPTKRLPPAKTTRGRRSAKGDGAPAEEAPAANADPFNVGEGKPAKKEMPAKDGKESPKTEKPAEKPAEKPTDKAE